MKKLVFTKYIACLFSLFLMSACSSVNTKVGGVLDLDTDFKLTFVADEDVNPDDSKMPSPVVVRMYELSSVKTFENANFIDLYEQDSEVLGKSLVTQQVLKAVKPGEKRVMSFVLSPEAKYIGLYVEYLQYEDAKYKVVVPVAQTNVVSTKAKVKLSGNRIIVLKQ